MIEQGALDGVDFILGQHMNPQLSAGEIGLTPGVTMAASDEIEIRISGEGGHGAYPHTTIDAIPIAAQVVTALQSVVSRQVDPVKPAVVTIGTIQGGYNFNVVADTVVMRGTVRTLEERVRTDVHRHVQEIVEGVAAAFGARGEVHTRFGYPATVNHTEGVALVEEVATRVLGAPNVHRIAVSMGGEDFSYYLERIPGCFYWLGGRHPNPLRDGYGLHHPGFDIDETALIHGTRLFVEAARSYLFHGKM